MIKRYHQSGHEGVTNAVDKLQQEVGAPCNSWPSRHGVVCWQAVSLSHIPLVVPLLWQQQLSRLERQRVDPLW